MHSKYLNADLISMIYFMSEIYAHAKASQAYFEHLFEHVKKDALFLYVDNNTAVFYEWFDALAKEFGFDVLRKEHEKMGMPTDEEKKDLGNYYEKFGSPKLDANVAYRVCRKL